MPRRPASAAAPRPSIDGLLASREILVACGPGGVGKTTTAAAAAVMAASRLGGKVLVVTVDPARRLADALGLSGGLGNEERPVPRAAFTEAGERPVGQLYAAMLDTKESWDALIRRHAPDKRTREQILANPLYRNISRRFIQSHDYIAMERLFEIHAEGDYDLIVVDTPPTRNALDFLDAPQRMADFFSSRLLKWLIVPYRSRLVNAASRPFYQVADRILGTQFLADISEFFVLFQTLHEGFVERAAAVERLLADRRTSFMVVSTLEGVPLREAEFFSEELTNRKLHLGAIVLNKVLPDYLLDPGGAATAERLRDDAAQLAGKLTDAVSGASAAQVERVLAEVGRSYLDYRLVAQRETEQRTELASRPEVLVSIPYFDTDITDVAGLVRLGEQLWGGR
jgi:anion-transporting  ArsA/GET3 family ATPase